MKKYLIAGNWKMNTNVSEAEKLTDNILSGVREFSDDAEILLCPPFTNLIAVKKCISDKSVYLGAQNCHWIEKGAFTGEVSCDMLKSVGCDYVIIGHSERRQYFGETDETVNKKIKAVLNHKMKPLVCIGETLEQRQKGITFDILASQVINGLTEIQTESFNDIIIAYEPVWAIGTGVAATIGQVAEAHDKLRELLISEFGDVCKSTLLLYGGSVNDENAKELMTLNNVNGALIGGASLNAETFINIYNFTLSLV